MFTNKSYLKVAFDNTHDMQSNMAYIKLTLLSKKGNWYNNVTTLTSKFRENLPPK